MAVRTIIFTLRSLLWCFTILFRTFVNVILCIYSRSVVVVAFWRLRRCAIRKNKCCSLESINNNRITYAFIYLLSMAASPALSLRIDTRYNWPRGRVLVCLQPPRAVRIIRTNTLFLQHLIYYCDERSSLNILKHRKPYKCVLKFSKSLHLNCEVWTCRTDITAQRFLSPSVIIVLSISIPPFTTRAVVFWYCTFVVLSQNI